MARWNVDLSRQFHKNVQGEECSAGRKWEEKLLSSCIKDDNQAGSKKLWNDRFLRPAFNCGIPLETLGNLAFQRPFDRRREAPSPARPTSLQERSLRAVGALTRKRKHWWTGRCRVLVYLGGNSDTLLDMFCLHCVIAEDTRISVHSKDLCEVPEPCHADVRIGLFAL